MLSITRLAQGSHTFTTTAGATLTYFVRGNGPHLLVNIAPGWGCASPLYQNSLTSLENTFKFAHLEVRGTRGSSFPENMDEMSSWDMASDVESLRVYLGVEAFDSLMGHSNGGCIALWYALRFPSRVSKLVLVDTSVLGAEVDALRKPATQAILDRRPERDAVEAAKGFDQSKFTTDEEMAAAMDAVLPLYFARPPRDMEHFKREIMTNIPQLKCAQALFAAERHHGGQDALLGGVGARTLLIVGREDFVCPVPVSDYIAQHIMGAEICVVEDSGHFPWIEQSAVFKHAITSFCEVP